MPSPVRLSFTLLIVAATLLAGCPETTPVSTDRCEHVGDACQLPNGTLGICSESLATECTHPPCIACTPQH